MTPKAISRRVAIYIRISKDRPNEVSMAVQEADGRTYSGLKGWEVVKVYQDRGKSGSKVKVVRDGYNEMLAAVDRGEIDVVVIWKLDRLGRSVIELNRVAGHLRSKGVDLVSVNDSIDTSTPGGRFVFTVFAALAQLEAEQISFRVRAAMEERVRRGRPHGGIRSFGYAPGGETVVPEERDVLVEAVERILEDGWSMADVTRDWNERKVPTVTGTASWWQGNVTRVLTSHHIAGLRYHEPVPDGQRANGRDGTVTVGDWPPIISPETRDRLIRHLADPIGNRTGTYQRAPLSGLLVCGVCGGRLAVDRSGFDKPTYRCRRKPNSTGCGKVSVALRPIERLIVDSAFVLLSRPEYRSGLRQNGIAIDVEALEAELAEIEQRRESLAADWAAGHLIAKEWSAARRVMAERQEDVETKLRAARALMTPSDADELPDTVEGLERWWEGADLADRRMMLRMVYSTITVNRAPRPGPFTAARILARDRVGEKMNLG